MDFRPERLLKALIEVGLALTILSGLGVVPGELPSAGAQSPVPGAAPKAPVDAQSDPELEAIRARLAKANAQTAAVLNELKAFDASAFQAGRTIAQNETEIKALQSKIGEAEARITQTEARAELVKKLSGQRARRMYQTSPATVIGMLLTPRTLADLSLLRVYWRSLAQQDGKVLLESMSLKDRLTEEKAALAVTSNQVAKRTVELNVLRTKLADSRKQRAASLSKLKTSIQEAMAAEKAVLAARAEAAAAAARAAAKAAAQQAQAPKVCSPGSAAQNAKLAALLNWYAPAAGAEPFMPPKLSGTDVTFNGAASWYGPGFEGCRASSGSTFQSSQMTAASLSLPFGALIKVSSGGKAVVVVITDRGPYIPGRDIDLSKAAAQAIGMGGTGSVKMEILLPSAPAPPYP
ncbi:MAG: RlpA-like double-psi beta-barrel domain-containing protein [Actinomycetota bacterium]